MLAAVSSLIQRGVKAVLRANPLACVQRIRAHRVAAICRGSHPPATDISGTSGADHNPSPSCRFLLKLYSMPPSSRWTPLTLLDEDLQRDYSVIHSLLLSRAWHWPSDDAERSPRKISPKESRKIISKVTQANEFRSPITRHNPRFDRLLRIRCLHKLLDSR
jgi:hypothetical protein